MMEARFFLLLLAGVAQAQLNVDLTSSESIISAASLVAYDLMTYYKGNLSGATPGILPGPPPGGPYYWWEGGALWGTMVDYWHFTQDTTYNNETQYSLTFQAGAPSNSYMPPNWTASMGNDDQGFWGMSAMLAAETTFQNPPGTDPQWLALAQAVFNTQAARWDTQYCKGGLRWQVYVTNNGYDYKNSIANGIFFNLAARLARYTGNSTYAEWAETAYNWTLSVGYIVDYNVYDGAHIEQNCTDVDKAQFSYNAAVFMQGAAFMYNYTNGSTYWEGEVRGFINRTIDYFFPGGIAVEAACELPDTVQCTTDELSFKGYLHRWMASTTQLAPFSHDLIMPTLKTSTEAALKSCSGGAYNRQCGFRWNTGTYDGDTGAGQEMSVLGAMTSLLIDQAAAPVTANTGGTSVGDPSAGQDATVGSVEAPITTGDRAGAGFLTILMLVSFVGVLTWMNTRWFEGGSLYKGI